MNYFDFAVENARREFDDDEPTIAYEPCCVVELLIAGPTGERVRVGSASFARCDADVFEGDILTITAMDDGYEMRKYPVDQWHSVVAYDRFGHISYVKENNQGAR